MSEKNLYFKLGTERVRNYRISNEGSMFFSSACQPAHLNSCNDCLLRNFNREPNLEMIRSASPQISHALLFKMSASSRKREKTEELFTGLIESCNYCRTLLKNKALAMLLISSNLAVNTQTMYFLLLLFQTGF